MNNKAGIRQRAARIYARMVEVRLIDEEELCTLPEEKLVLMGTRLFGRYDEDWEFDQRHDPDLHLDQKLEEAEFAVLRDTGPEGEALRPGARLTYVEVQYLLKHEALSVNSLLVHVESQRHHQVLRGRNHHLVLEPPYVPRRRAVAKNQPCGGRDDIHA